MYKALGLVIAIGAVACVSDGKNGADGVMGTAGSNGTDGALRIYGNGAAGPLIVAADQNWITTPPAGAAQMLQFTDLMVASGVTLTVPSGMIIRCTGSFTNAGTIVVSPGAAIGRGPILQNLAGSTQPYTPARAGVSPQIAQVGDSGNNVNNRAGGLGGPALPVLQATMLLLPGLEGGGTGASGYMSGTFGLRGGGSLVVLVEGSVANTATGVIAANGLAPGLNMAGNGGWGGGAGGVIVIASRTSITNDGQLQANGSQGGPSGTADAAGGGGGGGIIHLLGPTLDGVGTAAIAGGLAGTISGTITQTTSRAGGGGGGGCGGKGGDGALAGVTTSGAAEAGAVGQVISSTVDPTALF